MADVNQQLIAERLQISRATVSRCFTNHPGINPVTRARVFQLAAEIGYTHLESRTARSKKKKLGTTFGLLICSDEEEYQRTDYQNPGEQILAGVTECAQLNGIHVDVHLVDPKDRDLDAASYRRIEKFRRRWSGMLLVYPFPATVLEPLSLLMPVVSLTEQFDSAGIDWVDVDHYKGITSAIDHLIAQGHRRIGFFTRRYEVEASWSFRRYAAFVEKMVRLRMPVHPEDVINMFPSPDLGIDASHDQAAARTHDGVTAWICAADHQAYDLIRGLGQRGIRVPDEVSVTGFDGIAPPADCPTLATVHIPFREIGATGTRRLVERVRKRFGSAQHVLVDCPFEPGTSVAPPRDR
ncbi:MAG: LacI family DNA-binding transcriptional regulator [Verrucomicrobiota bacterium]